MLAFYSTDIITIASNCFFGRLFTYLRQHSEGNWYLHTLSKLPSSACLGREIFFQVIPAFALYSAIILPWNHVQCSFSPLCGFERVTCILQLEIEGHVTTLLPSLQQYLKDRRISRCVVKLCRNQVGDGGFLTLTLCGSQHVQLHVTATIGE